MKWLLFFALITGCFSCSNKTSKTNVLAQEHKVNNVTIEARFMKKDDVLDNPKTDSLKQNNVSNADENKFLYFKIKLSQPDFISDEKTTEHLNFKMQEDFKLIQDADTLAPQLVHRVINGQKNNYEYIVVFESDTKGTEEFLKIFYEDKIFGIGTQVFQFKKTDILK